MIKRKTNTQNVIIIILSILLLISIAFGVTYSYYNGKTNLVKGTITTASLAISLEGVDDKTGQTTEFSISAPYGDEFLVPGNSLNNVQLDLINKCNRKTYMLVLYSLTAVKNDETKTDISDQLTTMSAIDFQQGTVDYPWMPINYTCKDGSVYTCLVGLDEFNPNLADPITVLKPNSIRIPVEWDDRLQNCNVTISIRAFAIQAEGLGNEYINPILTAEGAIQTAPTPEAKEIAKNQKAQAVAKAILEICKIDI